MKVSKNFDMLCLSFLFIFGGIGIISIFILEHGLAKAWLALQEREFNMATGMVFLCTGVAEILFLTITQRISDRRRDVFRKKYSERYK